MTDRAITEKILIQHYREYPMMQIMDIFKFIYQSSHGCEHLISDLSRATEMIRREHEAMPRDRISMSASLDGDFCRVDLSVLDSGLSADTLGHLFYMSAKCESEGRQKLFHMLDIADELIRDGRLPFSYDEFKEERLKWEADGYPAVHHSDRFRESYKPAYRVVAKKFLPYLPLLTKLDLMLIEDPVRLAIEGGSATGKTTLSSMLKEIYGCTVFHMDDYFLRPEQRTAERFREPGGNVDRERFLEEVLLPLSEGKGIITYRPFDCSVFDLGVAVTVSPARLCVIEGAYSMHPELAGYYDLSVFLDTPLDERRRRILKRNPTMADRFFNEWMPMEDLYFREMNVRESCSFVIEL